MGATYFCYVHQDSKDPITYRDPMIEAFRVYEKTLIESRLRTGKGIYGNKRPNSNKRYTPPIRSTHK